MVHAIGPAGLVRMVAIALIAAGCAGPATTDEPPDPCNQTTDFTFAGRTSMAALGLSHPGDPDAGRVGMAWVTRGPVNWGGPPGGGGEMMRAACMSWEDGSGMGQSIEDGWQPPDSVFGGGAPVSEADGGPPVGLLALIFLAVVLIGVSVVAFRRDTR